MWKSIIVVAALAAGCKGSNVTGKLEGYRDEMCKCTDRACAERVGKDMLAWMESVGDSAKPSGDELKKISDLTDEIDKCEAKAKAPAK